MSTFVIAEKNRDSLITPVFHVDESKSQEAIAVFTTSQRAADYIREAGWQKGQEVGELDDMQLLRWLIQADEQRARYLMINPERTAQLNGDKQTVMQINEQLADLSQLLAQRIHVTDPGQAATTEVTQAIDQAIEVVEEVLDQKGV